MFKKDLFSARIYELRTTKNLTQQALADVVGIKKSAISMIENGQRAASIELLCALADYFNVSLDYLCGRTDNPEISK